jgi:hypothetical protein
VKSHSQLLCGFGLLVGCTPTDDSETKTTLPVDTDSIEYLEDDSWIDSDTGISGAYTNEEPLHTLTMTHTGQWDLLPLGGPFTSMVGELQVTELLDGDEMTPWCKVTFSLTGQAVDEVCPTCDFGFLILFYLSDEGDKKDPKVGGREDCQSPQLPQDGETRVLAYSEAESLLYFNYYGTDIWVPWYEAAQFRDELNYEWTDAAGFIGVEEDDQ